MPFFGRTNRYMVPMSGQSRNNFSTKHFPTKPVPIKKSQPIHWPLIKTVTTKFITAGDKNMFVTVPLDNFTHFKRKLSLSLRCVNLYSLLAYFHTGICEKLCSCTSFHFALVSEDFSTFICSSFSSWKKNTIAPKNLRGMCIDFRDG